MAIFFTWPKSGVTLFRTVLESYAEKKSLNYLNSSDSYLSDIKQNDIIQTEGRTHYFFLRASLSESSKRIGIFRDPRDQIISAYYYYKNLNDHENLHYMSEMYPNLTVHECVEQKLDDFKFWYKQFKNNIFGEMYTTLLSADAGFLPVRLENLCNPKTFMSEWKKIAEWTNLEHLDLLGIENSPCHPLFGPNPHVRSGAKPQEWDKIVPLEDLIKINRELKPYLDLLDKMCPVHPFDQ